MIKWIKVLKGVCSRYDSMYLTMCNPAVTYDAMLGKEKNQWRELKAIKLPLLIEAHTRC